MHETKRLLIIENYERLNCPKQAKEELFGLAEMDCLRGNGDRINRRDRIILAVSRAERKIWTNLGNWAIYGPLSV
jgi:hypothetical protein